MTVVQGGPPLWELTSTLSRLLKSSRPLRLDTSRKVLLWTPVSSLLWKREAYIPCLTVNGRLVIVNQSKSIDDKYSLASIIISFINSSAL